MAAVEGATGDAGSGVDAGNGGVGGLHVRVLWDVENVAVPLGVQPLDCIERLRDWIYGAIVPWLRAGAPAQHGAFFGDGAGIAAAAAAAAAAEAVGAGSDNAMTSTAAATTKDDPRAAAAAATTVVAAKTDEDDGGQLRSGSSGGSANTNRGGVDLRITVVYCPSKMGGKAWARAAHTLDRAGVEQVFCSTKV